MRGSATRGWHTACPLSPRCCTARGTGTRSPTSKLTAANRHCDLGRQHRQERQCSRHHILPRLIRIRKDKIKSGGRGERCQAGGRGCSPRGEGGGRGPGFGSSVLTYKFEGGCASAEPVSSFTLCRYVYSFQCLFLCLFRKNDHCRYLCKIFTRVLDM